MGFSCEAAALGTTQKTAQMLQKHVLFPLRMHQKQLRAPAKDTQYSVDF